MTAFDPITDLRTQLPLVIAEVENRCEDETQMSIVRVIVTHTPIYVWVVFVLLLVMGVRRLSPRRTHLAMAALAPVGFFVWSLATAASMFLHLNAWTLVAFWGIAFAAGAGSGRIRTVPRPTHVGDWIFAYSATWQPLAFYMLLFFARYGLGIWGGFVPSMANTLGLVGLSLSALTAGRTMADFIPPLAQALASSKARKVC